jgi:putative oxidoreductase
MPAPSCCPGFWIRHSAPPSGATCRARIIRGDRGKGHSMRMSSRIARPLLGSIFVAGGIDAVLHPENKVKKAEVVVRPLSEHIAAVPDDARMLVRINGGAQVAAAALLAVGRFRRIAAVTLIGSILPTTYAGHRFWEELDEEKRAQQQMHFFKNLGILGGLILAATDTEGAPSLTWRLRKRVGHAKKAGRSGQHAVGHRAKLVLDNMSGLSAQALRDAEGIAAREAPKVAEAASQYFHVGADRAGALLSQAHDHFASS